MRIDDYGVVAEGAAHGTALVATTPLSFWGGVNVGTGMIQDIHHDLCGSCVTGKVLCIPFDRGSCSGSGVMLEMIRSGTNPAALLCVEAEPVLALAPIVGAALYGRSMPIRTVSRETFEQIEQGATVTFADDAILVE